MRAILTMMIAILLPQGAVAETIATASILDPLARIFTACKNCQTMEALRTQVFVPVHGNVRLRSQAVNQMVNVYAFGDHLKELDQAALRGPHYANEIESYFILAADALPYDESIQLAEDIAYLNIEIGSRSIFERAVNKMPASCRRDFLLSAVAAKECLLNNEIEKENAAESGRKPRLTECPIMTKSVASCEAKRAARVN